MMKIVFLLVLLLTPVTVRAADSGPVSDAGSPEPEAPAAPALPADRMPTLSLEVKPTEVNVGEVIQWRLTVKHRIGDRVHLSSGASFEDLEVRSKDITRGETSGNWIEEILVVQLIGFEPGDVTIPAQKLTVVDTEGRIAEVETDTSTARVKSLIANEPEPKLKEDEGPGVQIFEKDYTLLWVLGILAGAGVVALLTLLGRWLWSKRRPKPGPPPPPPRPAEEIALEKLEELQRSNLLTEGLIKEFHVRLSETIREYLGNRYRFDSLELSTEELIQSLRKSTIGKSDFQITVDFLGETDLVKFAKMILTLEESRSLLEKSFEFVKRTTPQPVVPSEKTSASNESGRQGSGDA
ncbi:MAG: hypothetical protein GY854_27710 [Deltaproteobacteria bacterium]|nr:hypothetical protein [Deltaproteobacteria bacterium]